MDIKSLYYTKKHLNNRVPPASLITVPSSIAYSALGRNKQERECKQQVRKLIFLLQKDSLSLQKKKIFLRFFFLSKLADIQMANKNK